MTTKIEWVHRPGTIPESWNFIGGCKPVSEGCINCWAAELAATRLKNHPLYQGTAEIFRDHARWTGLIRTDEEQFERPLHWTKPRTVFVCSTSDIAHLEFHHLTAIMDVMARADKHTFLLLTKRPQRLMDGIKGWLNYRGTTPLKNVWIGVSAENQKRLDERWPLLRQIPAAVYFLSIEPCLGPISLPGSFLSLGKQSWCIVGGETGKWARPMPPNAPIDLLAQCKSVTPEIPFFFKQAGEWIADKPLVNSYTEGGVWQLVNGSWMARVGKKAAGRLLNGKEWNEFPG